jgi:predicted nicotinamide N-methyase
MDAWSDVVEEQVEVGGRTLTLVRPRDSMALLDQEAFEEDEYLPFWAELWPSGAALARRVAARDLAGVRVLELGCGLGLPSITAALGGARVTASDWSQDSLAFTRANAERSGAVLDTLLCSWAAPAPLLDGAPWDLVIAADVLYEQRNVDLLLDLLPRLVDDRGEVWLADPGRRHAQDFWERLGARWTRTSSLDEDGAAPVMVEGLRLAGARTQTGGTTIPVHQV